MCRWLAYSGSPILLEELLYKPASGVVHHGHDEFRPFRPRP